jgi:hypothetical protein
MVDMAGSSKALTNDKEAKELMKGVLYKAAPRTMNKTITFMEDNLDGVEESVLDENGQPVIDEKSGRPKTYMSPANLERMKLAHKIAHKIIDKVAPTVNKVEVEDKTKPNPLLMEAMARILSEKRAVKEKKIENAEYAVLDESAAASIRSSVGKKK